MKPLSQLTFPLSPMLKRERRLMAIDSAYSATEKKKKKASLCRWRSASNELLCVTVSFPATQKGIPIKRAFQKVWAYLLGKRENAILKEEKKPTPNHKNPLHFSPAADESRWDVTFPSSDQGPVAEVPELACWQVLPTGLLRGAANLQPLQNPAAPWVYSEHPGPDGPTVAPGCFPGQVGKLEWLNICGTKWWHRQVCRGGRSPPAAGGLTPSFLHHRDTLSSPHRTTALSGNGGYNLKLLIVNIKSTFKITDGKQVWNIYLQNKKSSFWKGS